MKPETCRKVGDRLSLYLDSRLSNRDRDLVDEHLVFCSLCSSELAALVKLQDLVGGTRSTNVLVKREFATPAVRKAGVAVSCLVAVILSYGIGHARGAKVAESEVAPADSVAGQAVEPLKRIYPRSKTDRRMEMPTPQNAVRVADIEGGEDFLKSVMDRMGVAGHESVIEESLVETIDENGVTRQITIRIR